MIQDLYSVHDPGFIFRNSPFTPSVTFARPLVSGSARNKNSAWQAAKRLMASTSNLRGFSNSTAATAGVGWKHDEQFPVVSVSKKMGSTSQTIPAARYNDPTWPKLFRPRAMISLHSSCLRICKSTCLLGLERKTPRDCVGAGTRGKPPAQRAFTS